EGLIGASGVAETDLNPAGKVFIQGEIWQAVSDLPVKAGERVRIVKVDGLQLWVEPNT
ncbi:MAG: NfeD family protein, partial [Candidatus Omnitrophica bacterium]|nr:NfeD family protein [Candidatus Omnitrophota bacterium]